MFEGRQASSSALCSAVSVFYFYRTTCKSIISDTRKLTLVLIKKCDRAVVNRSYLHLSKNMKMMLATLPPYPLCVGLVQGASVQSVLLRGEKGSSLTLGEIGHGLSSRFKNPWLQLLPACSTPVQRPYLSSPRLSLPERPVSAGCYECELWVADCTATWASAGLASAVKA